MIQYTCNSVTQLFIIVKISELNHLKKDIYFSSWFHGFHSIVPWFHCFEHKVRYNLMVEVVCGKKLYTLW